MPAAQEKIFFGQVWSVHTVIASALFDFFGQLLKFFNDHRTARLPERQSRTDFVIKEKDLQIFA